MRQPITFDPFWTDEQISKLGPWEQIMDREALDRYLSSAREMNGHDMAPVNGNSLYRFVGLIAALMAIARPDSASRIAGLEELVGEFRDFLEEKYPDEIADFCDGTAENMCTACRSNGCLRLKHDAIVSALQPTKEAGNG